MLEVLAKHREVLGRKREDTEVVMKCVGVMSWICVRK